MTLALGLKRIMMDTWFNNGAEGYSNSNFPVYFGFTTANPTNRNSYVDHYFTGTGGTVLDRKDSSLSLYDVINNFNGYNPVWEHVTGGMSSGGERLFNNTGSIITVQYAALFKNQTPNLSSYSQSDYDADLLMYWRLIDPTASSPREAVDYEFDIPANNYIDLSAGAEPADIYWEQ